jgi:hypothetical protein
MATSSAKLEAFFNVNMHKLQMEQKLLAEEKRRVKEM